MLVGLLMGNFLDKLKGKKGTNNNRETGRLSKAKQVQNLASQMRSIMQEICLDQREKLYDLSIRLPDIRILSSFSSTFKEIQFFFPNMFVKSRTLVRTQRNSEVHELGIPVALSFI